MGVCLILDCSIVEGMLVIFGQETHSTRKAERVEEGILRSAVGMKVTRSFDPMTGMDPSPKTDDVR